MWLKSICKKRSFSCCIYTTTGSFNDDSARIRLLLSKFTKVVALGGDGTFIKTEGLLIEADGELVGKTPAVISLHGQALLFHMPIKKRLQ